MSETPATYDCGAGCTCDAVTDLASERTELMDEMAAALSEARWTLKQVSPLLNAGCSLGVRVVTNIALDVVNRALDKYRGREEAGG